MLCGVSSGSILWSYLLGQLFYDVDIRNYGLDRNPGAMNAFRAKDFGLELQVGCWTRLRAFFLFTTLFAMLLGFVSLANGLRCYVAILGHIFSPFFKEREARA